MNPTSRPNANTRARDVLPRNVGLYWRFASLPTGGLITFANNMRTAREAGTLGRISAILGTLEGLAEMILLPRPLTAYLEEAGWKECSCALADFLVAIARAAPDWRESGIDHDGDSLVGIARSVGLLIKHPGNRVPLTWAHVDTFRRTAGQAVWSTPLLDLDIQGAGNIDGARCVLKAHTPPAVPVPTSNPAPKRVARMVRATPRLGRLRSVLLIGPSGAGKTMTALATAAELESAGRTLRLQGEALKSLRAEDLEQVIDLLQPTCVLLDDIDVADTSHLMHLLDHLAGSDRQVLVLATVMHEGAVEDARLPGLRPERVDVIVPFRTPTDDDRRAILVHYGLDEELAGRLAADERIQRLTGAYLRALADRLLAGMELDETIGSLVLHQTIAGHNHSHDRHGGYPFAITKL